MALTAVMVTAVALDLTAANLAEGSDLGGNRSVRSVPCDINAYPYQGKCCQYCPAGTRVLQHCSNNHGQRFCAPCITGVSFTAYANGLEACLPCSSCRETDQEEVESCTATSNTKCQCRSGSYCIPNETCDLYCKPCSSCPEGQRERHHCNATSDVICEEMTAISSNSDSTIILSVLLPMLLLVGILVTVWWKRRNAKQEPRERTDVLESVPFSQEERGHVTTAQTADSDCSENQVVYEAEVGEMNVEACAEQPAHTSGSGSRAWSGICRNEELDDSRWFQCYSSLKDNVPPCRWKELMRGLGLSENDIEHITIDQADSREKNYQMFFLWRKQKGRQASMSAVFRVLDEVNLKGCREQTDSDLQSKGIHIPYLLMD